MGRAARTKDRRRKTAPGIYRALKWTVALAAVAGLFYAASQNQGFAYDEDDLTTISFSSLTDRGRRDALTAANRARCTCGCGMTLAQCVATDSTCPVREGNIDKIKTMVRQAEQQS